MHQGKYKPVDSELKEIRTLDYISMLSKPPINQADTSQLYEKMRGIVKNRNITIFTPRAIDRTEQISQDGYTVNSSPIDFVFSTAERTQGKLKFINLKNRG